jgi:hypothetical protein
VERIGHEVHANDAGALPMPRDVEAMRQAADFAAPTVAYAVTILPYSVVQTLVVILSHSGEPIGPLFRVAVLTPRSGVFATRNAVPRLVEVRNFGWHRITPRENS